MDNIMTYKRGPRVYDLVFLNKLAKNRKSVYVPKSAPFKKHQPAAWMINLQGHILVRLFDLGMYVYEPQKEVTK